ncbi:YwhD family protein [Marinicrinis lubricantis]|uniref:YwhD family protein n=1 Tax=Marinicrinis lubricantis TaxID=2086470 RepID=A0ABW1IW24_9BACL
MMDNKKLSLNIISTKKNAHQGFGSGMIDLSNLSSVIIDGDEAYIDLGALHAKSKVERRIKFLTERSEVPNGRTVWLVWVAVDRTEQGAYYAGLTACEMLIDTEARRGWKILAQHVNLMDRALKRKVILDGLGTKEKGLLRQVLIDNNADIWERTPQEIKDQLEGEGSEQQ